MKDKKGYVYLICDPQQNRYKVGATKGTIEHRIIELQTGNSSELHIANYHETDYPFRVEKMMHSKLREYRIHGEWFELPDNIVFKFKEYCDKCEKTIEALKENPFFTKGLK